MQWVLTDDQQLIAKTARAFAVRHSPLSRLRQLRDSRDGVGFSRDLWHRMVELGWAGMAFPDEMGGAGLGLADLCIVLEELGRQLAPEPLLSASLMAGRALALADAPHLRSQWLDPLLGGEVLISLAHQERGARFERHRVAHRAERDGDTWRLAGQWQQVIDGHVADALILPLRTSGSDHERSGITLFIIPTDAPAVQIDRQWRIDGGNAALVSLETLTVTDDSVLGPLDGGADLLDDVLDGATVGLCAEMLGGMSAAFEMTLDYLKQRKQFGVAIGSFQALKHRTARLFIDVEMSRSAVMAAARSLDAHTDDAPLLVSVAKAQCSDAFMHVAHESIQLHGGIGMTDEFDLGFYLKRARAAEMTFGDAAWHRDRWARLRGY